jgi:hypothetical protein
MLFGETVAVYCENHTEHIDTLCGQNIEFVPHRKIGKTCDIMGGFYFGTSITGLNLPNTGKNSLAGWAMAG